jgi:hypothetical protein
MSQPLKQHPGGWKDYDRQLANKSGNDFSSPHIEPLGLIRFISDKVID